MRNELKTLWIRFVASLILAAFGGGLLPELLPLGLLIVLVGVSCAVWYGGQIVRERRDPYDLTKLWEGIQEEPEDDGIPRDFVYCHRCDTALPPHVGICPKCGNPLGR